MNIYEKLIEVRKSCEYLKKDTQGDRFKFVSSSQTLGTLRGAMDDHGLLLVPSVIGNEVRRHENNIYKPEDIPKKQYFTILEMTFTWINAEKPEEQVVCQWTGHGLDDAEKGVGKAVTYAEKYFLLKFFNIATDKDDPDAHQNKTSTDAPPQDKKPAQAKPKAPQAKIDELIKLVNENFGTRGADCLKELTTFGDPGAEKFMELDKLSTYSAKWIDAAIKKVKESEPF